MNRFARFAVASRTFCIATVLGLNLAFPDATALQATILLAAISACALAADLGSELPEGPVSLVEAVFVALTIGLALPEGIFLLPYLMIPALLAGLGSGAAYVALTVLAELVALTTLAALGNGIGTQAELVAPWVLTGVGAGALGVWLRRLWAGQDSTDDESYESARRLLSQLRAVARRLSSGLDPVSMASQMLVTVHQHLDDAHGAVFVREEGGVLAPLGYRGHTAREALLPEGEAVDTCWTEMEPVQRQQRSGGGQTRHRVALPLRVGSRMIGVVVCEAPQPAPPRVLQTLMRELDEQALRLDTALVFDEVRSIATLEERQRLAREIHDGVAQEVASLGYVVDALAAGADSEEQRAELATLRGEITRVVSELRLSIFDLRSEISPTAGLGSTLSDYVRAVGARSGLTVHLTLDEGPTRLRGEVETELLRIAQEAITNARKHASAENLWVDCSIHPPFARIVVRDDGHGLGTPRADSYGLKIMRERAQRIDAAFDVRSEGGSGDAKGTTVTVTVGGESPTGAVSPEEGHASAEGEHRPAGR